MFTFSFPPRPILRFFWAAVTVPQAMLPFGITTIPFTLIESRTSKSTWSPTWALADEIVLVSLSLIGVPSSKMKPLLEDVLLGADCWACPFIEIGNKPTDTVVIDNSRAAKTYRLRMAFLPFGGHVKA